MSDLLRDGSDRTDPAALLPGETLQFTAAACQLAKDLWCARRRAFDEPRQWVDLPADVRHWRIEMAAWLLRTQERERV